MSKPEPAPRSAYRAWRSVTTRWADNDAYGHVNNVVYYAWFDTAVNAYLIEQGALDIHGGEVIGLVVETQCNYFSPLAFPQSVDVGLRVAHCGRSSVRYELGVFAADQALPAAQGHFVHVYVDAEHRNPAPLPSGRRWPRRPDRTVTPPGHRGMTPAAPGARTPAGLQHEREQHPGQR
jgi:acyl-CoA thioester hydrolase